MMMVFPYINKSHKKYVQYHTCINKSPSVLFLYSHHYAEVKVEFVDKLCTTHTQGRQLHQTTVVKSVSYRKTVYTRHQPLIRLSGSYLISKMDDDLMKKLSRRNLINEGEEGAVLPSTNVFNPFTEFKEFSRKEIQGFQKTFNK